MDLLSRLEQALEDVVEGVFSRAFRTRSNQSKWQNASRARWRRIAW